MTFFNCHGYPEKIMCHSNTAYARIGARAHAWGQMFADRTAGLNTEVH